MPTTKFQVLWVFEAEQPFQGSNGKVRALFVTQRFYRESDLHNRGPRELVD